MLILCEQSFLYIMSLRTGVELISLSVIFNKMTGFYGFLAILTGLQLNPTQFSMYLYSVLALVIMAFLMPHIRKQSPFQCLALAWFYLFDTVINCAFTITFAMTWFLNVSATQDDQPGSVNAPGSGIINDTAGFMNPGNADITNIEVTATPAAGLAAGVAAVAASEDPTVAHGLQLAESAPSIFIIVFFTLIRVYFIFVMMSFARQVIRSHMISSSSPQNHLHLDGVSDEEAMTPFAPDLLQGQGLKGKFGRAMLFVGKDYWVGKPSDEDWVRNVQKRFKTPKIASPTKPRGTLEREKRARSGTGPPQPPLDLLKTNP
jgi:hypothetical protein